VQWFVDWSVPVRTFARLVPRAACHELSPLLPRRIFTRWLRYVK